MPGGARDTPPTPVRPDLDRRTVIDTAVPEPSNTDEPPRLTAALRLLRRAHLHDLRGELNALRLQVTLLQRGGSSADPERLAGWIEGVASQAGALERGLDQMATIEQLDDQLSDATVAEIASRVVELLRPLARNRRVELRSRDDEDGSGSGSETAPGLARRLLKLGARCLILTPTGAECTVSCTSSVAESANEAPTGDGVLLEISTDTSETDTSETGPAGAQALFADSQLAALRQGIHSEGWTVERQDRGVVLRIPR